MRDPNTAPNTIEILAPNLADAKTLAAKIDKLPEVDRTVTLASFVPDQQAEKLALIRDCYDLIGPTIEPDELAPAPSDADTKQTLLETAKAFEDVSRLPGASPLAAHMASTLRKLADATPSFAPRSARLCSTA